MKTAVREISKWVSGEFTVGVGVLKRKKAVMKSAIACVPCMVEHAVHVAQMVSPDLVKQEQIVKQVMAQIAAIDFNTAPPEMARTIHTIIRGVTGVDDPYLEVKDQSTELTQSLLPELRQLVDAFSDPFETIVRLVIAGNIIDFGADQNFELQTARERVMEVLQMPIDTDAVKKLHRKLDASRRVLYLLDNCGEAVIDRLLIEPYRDRITIAVRGGAILNDITRREVESSGLAGLAPIIDSGDRTPGTALKFVTPEFRRCFEDADLIVSKGQGNYETLSDTDRPICFLLRVKCPEVAGFLNDAPLGSLQTIIRNF